MVLPFVRATGFPRLSLDLGKMPKPRRLLCRALPAIGILLMALSGEVAAGDSQQPERRAADAVTIENELCRIEFDPDTGALRGITNRAIEDPCLKGGRAGQMPFRIYADLTREFEIRGNDKFQLVFDDPAAICRTIIEPQNCRLAEVKRDNGLTLRYEGQGLEVRLQVSLADNTGVSDWSLRVTNTGTTSREFLASFPYLDGVRLGPDPAGNMATAMDQAGVIVPAWERPGGVLGESNQLSMQWHAVWDPVTKSALAVIFMDPEARPKRLILAEPAIELHYFPPITLAPGAYVDLPPARILVYKGDWRPAARAYRAWYDQAYPHVEPPAWFRQSNGNMGIHLKKADPGAKSGYFGQWVLDSFRQLPQIHLSLPIDNLEYAFYCRTSMLAKNLEFTPHTDGENIIREDMGGPDAMREGIAAVHRLGFHVTLYVDGYIVPEESDLGKSGKPAQWAVMHKDGTMTGPYTKQGYLHMCPGCVEWQDHLAAMVARLLRETDADAIRLDSLGFYYLPCYNPAHHHDTPFGYNDWLKQLLGKVRASALAVKPDVLLLTEGSADWLGPWFHGALTSRCPRDLSPMRLAVGPFRTYVYASGALWGSLSGFPGGGCSTPDIHSMDWNWLCARFPAHEALVWGDVADQDPASSDPEIVTRQFEGKGYWAVVAARPACQDPLVWPRGTGVATEKRPYTLTLPGLAPQTADAVLCDIETLTWSPLDVERAGSDLVLRLATNWALVILRRPDGPGVAAIDPLPEVARGASVTMRAARIGARGAQSASDKARISAPGLTVVPDEIALPGDATITVPPDALPGNYTVYVSGDHLLGARRFLVVP